MASKVALTPAQILLVQKFMYDTCGIDLKDKEYLISSKISLLCFSHHIGSFDELWKKMQMQACESKSFRQLVIDSLTTGYSFFYREESHFAILRDLIRQRKLPVHKDFLVGWSAGCSSGQEPYNLVMALSDLALEGSLSVPFHVTGSDICSQSLKNAADGHYSLADYVRLPEYWRERYCFKVPGGCEIRKKVRDSVDFRLENVLNPLIVEPFDFVFCRNVLIYFNKDSIHTLYAVLNRALLPGGYLFLGHAEIVNDIPGFTYMSPSVYIKNSAGD